MEREKYMREGIDLKRLILLFLKKTWVILLTGILGAVIGGLLYNAVVAYRSEGPQYRLSSDYFITFNFSEYENSSDYYNAYTWNGFLHDDPIVDAAMKYLPDTVKKEEVKDAVLGEMLGDYRVLTVHVTTKDPKLTEEIAYAYTQSLAEFADKIEMLTSVELWSRGTTELLKENNRTANAAFLGGLLGVLFTIIVLLILYLLDDSVYVEADFAKRYQIPFLGTVTNKKEERRLQEIKDNYQYLCKSPDGYYLVNVAMTETIENPCVPLLVSLCPGIKRQVFLKEDGFEKIRKSGGAILLIPYGKTNGKLTEKTIMTLQKQDCQIAGAILTDADDKFLKAYYLGRKE